MLISHKALGKNVCKLFSGINFANMYFATHMGAKEMVLHSYVFGTKGGLGRFGSQTKSTIVVFPDFASDEGLSGERKSELGTNLL